MVKVVSTALLLTLFNLIAAVQLRSGRTVGSSSLNGSVPTFENADIAASNSTATQSTVSGVSGAETNYGLQGLSDETRKEVLGSCDVEFSKKVVLIESLDRFDEGKQLSLSIKSGMVKLDSVYDINEFQAPFTLHGESRRCLDLKPGGKDPKIICFRDETIRKDAQMLLTRAKLCKNLGAKPRADMIGAPSAEEEEDNAFHSVKPGEGGVMLTFYPSEGVNPSISIGGN